MLRTQMLLLFVDASPAGNMVKPLFCKECCSPFPSIAKLESHICELMCECGFRTENRVEFIVHHTEEKSQIAINQLLRKSKEIEIKLCEEWFSKKKSSEVRRQLIEESEKLTNQLIYYNKISKWHAFLKYCDYKKKKVYKCPQCNYFSPYKKCFTRHLIRLQHI